MNNSTEQPETLELTLDEFVTAKLPSLDDLMREFDDDKNAPKSLNGAGSKSVSQSSADSEFSRVTERLQRIEAENIGLTSDFERVAADFEKYRWRTERERSEHYAFAVISIVRQFLPVLDNFERALQNVKASQNQNLQQFVSGVEMIYQQNVKFLQDIGVRQMNAKGTQFDPRLHEAIETEPRADVAPNTILEEILHGYQMGEKLVRPALVKVSKRDEE